MGKKGQRAALDILANEPSRLTAAINLTCHWSIKRALEWLHIESHAGQNWFKAIELWKHCMIQSTIKELDSCLLRSCLNTQRHYLPAASAIALAENLFEADCLTTHFCDKKPLRNERQLESSINTEHEANAWFQKPFNVLVNLVPWCAMQNCVWTESAFAPLGKSGCAARSSSLCADETHANRAWPAQQLGGWRRIACISYSVRFDVFHSSAWKSHVRFKKSTIYSFNWKYHEHMN